MQHPHLENGVYYANHHDIFSIDAIIERYCQYGKELDDLICDTDAFMRANAGRRKILLEGAQGLMLSVDKGSYPFVTSSDCSAQGLTRGVGLSDCNLDLTLQIVKAFYMTRVGGGPFPTELGGEASAKHCGQEGMTEAVESQLYPNASVNDDNELAQGVGFRKKGKSYGATTGRPRRTGWLDLPVLRYAVKDSGPNLVLTKLDVLSECETIKICEAYIYEGPVYRYGCQTLKSGDRLEVAIPQSEVLEFCRPVYREFPGWMSDIRDARNVKDLPQKLARIIDYVATSTKSNPQILSVGPDREETIIL
jgi:adenylosuccinate synthase